MLFQDEMMTIERISTNELNLNTGVYSTDWLVYRLGTVHEDIKALAAYLCTVKCPHDWTPDRKRNIFEDIVSELHRNITKKGSKYMATKTINRWPGIEIITQRITEDCCEIKVSTQLTAV